MMTQHLKQQKEENLPSKTQEKEPVPEAPKAKITENAPPENCIIPMYPEESNSSYYNEIMAMKNQQNVLKPALKCITSVPECKLQLQLHIPNAE